MEGEFDILAKIVERPTIGELVVSAVEDAEGSREEVVETPIDAEVSVFEERVDEVRRDIDEVRKGVEELRSGLENIKRAFEELAESVKSVEARSQAMAKIVETVALWKCSRCRFYRDGVCTAWRISEDFAKIVESVFGPEAIVRDGDAIRLRIDRAFVISAVCPLFRAK